MRKGLWFLLALWLLGCSGTFLTTEGLDKSCTITDDCVAVLVGDLCNCECNYEAINKKDLLKFQEQDKNSRSCDKTCGVCLNARVTCNSGQCIATKVN